MNKQQTLIRLAIFIVGAIAFHILFWKNIMGLNALLFCFMVTGVAATMYRPALSSRYTQMAFGAFVIATIGVVVVHTLLAMFMYWISLLALIAYLHHSQLKAPIIAIPITLGTIIKSPFALIADLINQGTKRFRWIAVIREARIILIPLVIVFIFFAIFFSANPLFQDIVNAIAIYVERWVNLFFENISIAQIVFFGVGAFVWGGLMYQQYQNRLVQFEQDTEEFITRRRKPQAKMPYAYQPPKMALKSEFKAAVYTMVMVNLLLLVINILDILWVWIGVDFQKVYNLRQFVHEGTYMLIFSIFLAISIMLYFFRNNLNFYPKYNTLKKLSMVWIVQNAILVISVGIRNYYYISHYGLAYKRIGLVLFLLMVLYGLYSVYAKISSKRSRYFLFRSNSWAVFLILTAATLIDWDMVIMRYNTSVKYSQQVDVEFLLALPDKTVPTLLEHPAILALPRTYQTFSHNFDLTAAEAAKVKAAEFVAKKNAQSILSWNLAEQRAYNKLIEAGVKTAE